MASSPLPGGPRHVGRVIDPSVREDGEREPSLELEADPSRAAAPEAPVPEIEDASPLLRGTLLRERLLERAAQNERPPDYDQDGAFADLDQIGRSEENRAPEPDVATGPVRAPSAPIALGRRGRLSPNQLALFTTLLGVATVASLIALASNLDSAGGLAPAPSASAVSSTSSAQPPPAAELPPARPKRARQKIPGPWRIEDVKNDPKMRTIDGQVKSDAFLTALEKAGIEQRERYRILTAMKGIRDFDRCKKTDRFRVVVEQGGSKVKAFEYIAGPGEVYQAREGDDGLLKGAKLDLKLERNQVTGALLYDGTSFDASAERSGFDPGLRKVVAKALDGHMDMNELDRGDRLRVVAQETTVLGEFGSYAGIEAIEVRSSDGARSPLRVYFFEQAGERGYFDAEGRSPYEGGWRKPVKDAAMTSPFNLKRLHPILKRVVPHLGIDFGAPTGTPVGASSFGSVSFVGYNGPAGNFVRIDHANGIQTGYAHLSRFAEGLKVGDRVKRLQVIGYVGSTGRSTGPHLHFSAQRGSEFFDPVTLRLDAMRTLSKDGRVAFAQVKAKYDALLDALPLPEPLPAPTPAPEPLAPAASSAGAAPAQPSPASVEADEHDSDEEPAQAPPVPPLPPKSTAGGSMVHLTDQELLELSGSVEDGEVAE